MDIKELDQQAFPTSAGNHTLFGMTLRDYFAAKAMQSLIAGSFTDVGQEGIDANRCANQNIEDLMAATAYQYANAMLKAREA
jgi:hypothetical protein